MPSASSPRPWSPTTRRPAASAVAASAPTTSPGSRRHARAQGPMLITPPTSSPQPRELVTAFDPSSRSWVTAGSVDSSLKKLPELDGTLLVSAQALQDAADDFGHVVSRRPSAVL